MVDETENNNEDIKKTVESRVAEEKKLLEDNDSRREINSKFIRDCLNANELGNGILFAALHAGKFVYNKSSKEWLIWQGHHWQRDIMDRARAAVEDLSICYLEEAKRIVEEINAAIKNNDSRLVEGLSKIQKKIFGRVWSLRSQKGRTSTLEFAHSNPETSLEINNSDLNQNNMLFACQNGVIDLRSGELRAGHPKDLISKASPIVWEDIEHPAPTWELFLEEIFQKEYSLISYIQRLLGYAITGLTSERILPIFVGQGRNGKSTMVEIINYIMGELSAPVRSELLLDQGRARDSASASPDIMALQGLRIAFGSESDENRRFSTSRVKWLSGSDTLVGRNPYDKNPTEFKPTHKLFLITNNIPHAPHDDFAFWERLHLIPFELSFVTRKPQADNERPADKYLDKKLELEASGILAWLVRGCLQWQEKGLDPPQIVREETAKRRREEDWLADFIDECCNLRADAQCGASDIYTAFREWWADNVSKKGIPSQRKFGKWMIKKFHREKIGTYQYFGVELLDSQI